MTDHLGSITAALDSSGNLLSQQRYLPFGEVREDVGAITQTDIGYTSQRNLPDLGLMDYRARFYSPYVTQFTQPDTIIPGPDNPQTLNRYAYVHNSPINLSDPTGHCGEGSTPSQGITADRHERLCQILAAALELSAKMKSGEITDVEALAQLMDSIAPLYQDGDHENGQDFIEDLGIVVGGIELRFGLPPFELIDDEHNMGQYYIGYAAFTPDGSSGFKVEYTDNIQNQVRHFVGGMVGGSWFMGLGRGIQLGQEDDPYDENLYGQSYEFLDYLAANSISDGGKWVRKHLAREKSRSKLIPK